MPAELQQRVIAEVDLAKERSQMRVNDSLRHQGIPRGTFYRWKKQRAWEREPVTPVQAFEALPDEKEAVVQYALDHSEIRHRELSWRMIDEDVAYLSASTVDRILRAESLMHRQRCRTKRYREEAEKASRPDEIWATDLMYLKVGGVHDVHRRVFALPGSLGVAHKHGRSLDQHRGAAGDRNATDCP